MPKSVCRDCSDVALAKKGVDPADKGKPEQAKVPEPEAAPQLAREGNVGTRLHVVA